MAIALIEKVLYLPELTRIALCTFYIQINSPNFKEAWQMLRETQVGDNSPIRNILTLGILGILGIWGILSLGNRFVPALIRACMPE